MASKNVSSWWATRGFEVIDTGGGCRALYHKVDAGPTDHVLVTSADHDGVPESLAEAVIIGFYDGNHGEPLRTLDSADSPQAFAAIVGDLGLR